MRKKLPYTSPGDYIKAKDLSNLARVTNRHDNSSSGTGQGGFHTSDFDVTLGPPPVRLYVARCNRDILPDHLYEANRVNLIGDGYCDGNADICVWDAETLSWIANGKKVFVLADYLPLLMQEVLVIYFNRTSGNWVVLERQYDETIVEVLSETVNADGYQDAQIVSYDQDQISGSHWAVFRDCHATELNNQ